MSDFGRRCKALREARGLTRRRFAEILGIESRSIARYEETGSLLRVDTAVKIAKFFAISVEEMVEGE